MAETQSGLEMLTKKYGRSVQRQDVNTSFDSSSNSDSLGSIRSLGNTPDLKTLSPGEVSKQLASVQLEMTDLADSYGKMGLTFNNLVGQERIYGFSDALKIAGYSVVMNKKKVREVKVEAIGRRGNAIENLVNKMADVMEEQYQRAVQGKNLAENLQVENISIMRRLDNKLIENLKNGHYTSSDMAKAEKEAKNIENEIREIDSVLAQYDGQVRTARAEGKIEDVDKLTKEMTQVLDMKYKVMDGKLTAEGIVSEIRREILDSAEGVQSAKGAMAASRVNYSTISTLIDAMSELEIKYRHAKEDMLPVFKVQGRIAAIGSTAMDVKKTLQELSRVSTKLLSVNENLVKTLGKETLDLLQNPVYDISAAREIEQRMTEYRTQLNGLKMAWADKTNTIVEAASAGYSRHR